MPQNKLLYYGLLVIAASALIYAGNWLVTKIAFIVPFTIGVGALMIIGGLVMESKKKKAAAAQQTPPPV